MYNAKQFEAWAKPTHNEIFNALDRFTICTENGRYAYIDNGSNVLAVAHCDTVQHGYHYAELNTGGKRLALCPKMDDRLGLYTIMELLPKLGIHTDILVTENEEQGRSTGKYFVPHKKYNWMVEFDRTGEDVATYDYDDIHLTDFFPKLARGTYTDIADMEHLECQGFNVGVGMYNYHDLMAYADISMFERQIKRFVKFHEQNKDKRLPYAQVRGYLDFRKGIGFKPCELPKDALTCHECLQEFSTDDVYDKSPVCPYCYADLDLSQARSLYENWSKFSMAQKAKKTFKKGKLV